MKHFRVICIFIIILILILVGGYFGIKYVKNKTNNIGDEYTPQEEINDEQNRKTIVTLYFLDNQTSAIIPEARLIDAASLIKTPYDKIINLLLEGPKNENLKSIIPKDTKLLGTSFSNDCILINFSKEFSNYNNEDEKNKSINTIVNTLTELTEINSIKFLINGKEDENFKNTYVRI